MLPFPLASPLHGIIQPDGVHLQKMNHDLYSFVWLFHVPLIPDRRQGF